MEIENNISHITSFITTSELQVITTSFDATMKEGAKNLAIKGEINNLIYEIKIEGK